MKPQKAACRSKNPTHCPYHGSRVNATKVTALQQRIANIFNLNKKEFIAPSINMFTEDVEVRLEVEPLNKAAKSSMVLKSRKATTEEAMKDIANQLSNFSDKDLKTLKSGYRVNLVYPMDSLFSTVKGKDFNISRSLDEVKNNFTNSHTEFLKNDALVQSTFTEMEEQGETKTPNGAKALAVVKAMNSFSYFSGSYADAAITQAYDSIVSSKTSEYTNRGVGVRVYFDYDYNGNVTRARFSLDDPNSLWSTFQQTEIDTVNNKLKEYFSRVDIASH